MLYCLARLAGLFVRGVLVVHVEMGNVGMNCSCGLLRWAPTEGSLRARLQADALFHRGWSSSSLGRGQEAVEASEASTCTCTLCRWLFWITTVVLLRLQLR